MRAFSECLIARSDVSQIRAHRGINLERTASGTVIAIGLEQNTERPQEDLPESSKTILENRRFVRH